MTITRYDPNTIFLGSSHDADPVLENTIAVSEAVTPGHLVERFNNGGVHRWRKHTNVTADSGTPPAVALEQAMLNQGVDDAYAANDLALVSIGYKGCAYWMFVASGQTIVFGDPLESAGDGTLRKFTTGVVLFTALEDKTALALTRIRVEVA